MPLLTPTEIKLRMPTVPGWERSGKTIHREITFKSFMGSIAFVRKVAAAAETKDHHPDIDIRWNRVKLVLSTHSEGGLTTKDFALARLCNAAARLVRG